MDDNSGDDEGNDGEEDWLRQGWRSETGSLFQRWGDVCRNEQFVIFNEELKQQAMEQ